MAPGALVGVLLQFAAAGLLGVVRRPLAGQPVEFLRVALGLALMIGAIELTRRSLRHLGTEWAMGAGKNEKSTLVTTGPYARIRHPFYLAFFLLTAGFGLAVSRPLALLAALPLSAVGMALRIVREERVLDELFGEEHIRYRSRVPALLPRLPSPGRERTSEGQEPPPQGDPVLEEDEHAVD